MNRFLYHTSCERCGSSDAKAIYSQGDSFCFSCRSVNSAKISPYVSQNARQQDDAEMLDKAVRYPSDATKHYSEGALAWCKKYEITVEQLLKETIYYSAARDQLIFGFEAKGRLIAYQARNLNAVSKAKRYYTCGDVNNLLPIYPCRFPLSGSINEPQTSLINARRLVLVEDCLSAIKTSYVEGLYAVAMPLLGSGINLRKLTQLKRFYEILDVFLDPDMWHKSLNIVKQAQMLGFEARAVQSDRDPKEHSYSQLKELLT